MALVLEAAVDKTVITVIVTADSDPIYQAFSWHIQIFFLNLHAE